MAQDDQAPHSPPNAPKRPKGILKKSTSFQQTSPEVSPTSERPPATQHENGVQDEVAANGRPSLPTRGMSDKEITQMNTEINAGGQHRRNSSNPRGSMSRRQSSQSNAASSSSGGDQHDEHGMRLKWDEANLYLNEGQMGGRMKIDEPKTPYAKQYDPAEDEEEIETINAQEVAVDELEMGKSSRQGGGSRRSRESEIPGLDLGEPEMDPLTERETDGENKVIVESDSMDVDGGGGHGEKREEDMSREEREKHKRFEQMRKRHYEMRDVKNLLGHGMEDMDDDDQGENNQR